jgi:hypothetical protein
MELINRIEVAPNLVAAFYENWQGQIEALLLDTTDATEGGKVLRAATFHESKMDEARAWAGL